MSRLMSTSVHVAPCFPSRPFTGNLVFHRLWLIAWKTDSTCLLLSSSSTESLFRDVLTSCRSSGIKGSTDLCVFNFLAVSRKLLERNFCSISMKFLSRVASLKVVEFQKGHKARARKRTSSFQRCTSESIVAPSMLSSYKTMTNNFVASTINKVNSTRLMRLIVERSHRLESILFLEAYVSNRSRIHISRLRFLFRFPTVIKRGSLLFRRYRSSLFFFFYELPPRARYYGSAHCRSFSYENGNQPSC